MVVAAGVTLYATPLAAEIFPGMMTPLPLLNTPVSWATPPVVMLMGLAVKLVMVGMSGAGTTVTVAVAVVLPAAGLPPKFVPPRMLGSVNWEHPRRSDGFQGLVLMVA